MTEPKQPETVEDDDFEEPEVEEGEERDTEPADEPTDAPS